MSWVVCTTCESASRTGLGLCLFGGGSVAAAGAFVLTVLVFTVVVVLVFLVAGVCGAVAVEVDGLGTAGTVTVAAGLIVAGVRGCVAVAPARIAPVFVAPVVISPLALGLSTCFSSLLGTILEISSCFGLGLGGGGMEAAESLIAVSFVMVKPNEKASCIL